jgi:hypothetical protein
MDKDEIQPLRRLVDLVEGADAGSGWDEEALHDEAWDEILDVLDDAALSAVVAALHHPKGAAGVNRLRLSTTELDRLVAAGPKRVAMAVIQNNSAKLKLVLPAQRQARKNGPARRDVLAVPAFPHGLACPGVLIAAASAKNCRLKWAPVKEWIDLPLGEPIPESQPGRPIVAVSLGARAQRDRLYEGRPLIGVLGAPPVPTSEIVVRADSGLANLEGVVLAARLQGTCIAVSDPLSTFALRLAAAVHQIGGSVRSTANPDRQAGYLTLVGMELGKMPTAVANGTIDGFSAGEPYRTIAFHQYGKEILGTATLDSARLPATAPFCCCVVLDEQGELSQNQELFRGLISDLSRAMIRLAEGNNETRVCLEEFYRGVYPNDESEVDVAVQSAMRHAASRLQVKLEGKNRRSVGSSLDEIVDAAQPVVSPQAIASEQLLIRLVDTEERIKVSVAIRSGGSLDALFDFYRLDPIRAAIRRLIASRIPKVRSKARAIELQGQRKVEKVRAGGPQGLKMVADGV